jgi:hypothetical protein
VSTWQGWLYVAFVIDVFARCIVGWRVSTRMTACIVLLFLFASIESNLDVLSCKVVAVKTFQRSRL